MLPFDAITKTVVITSARATRRRPGTMPNHSYTAPTSKEHGSNAYELQGYNFVYIVSVEIP